MSKTLKSKEFHALCFAFFLFLALAGSLSMALASSGHDSDDGSGLIITENVICQDNVCLPTSMFGG